MTNCPIVVIKATVKPMFSMAVCYTVCPMSQLAGISLKGKPLNTDVSFLNMDVNIRLGLFFAALYFRSTVSRQFSSTSFWHQSYNIGSELTKRAENILSKNKGIRKAPEV